MAEYGVPFDSSFDPQVDEDKNSVYKLFRWYFDDPVFSKVRQSDDHAIYMARMDPLLSNEYRYLVAIVENDRSPVDTKNSLGNLKWVSLQTRSLPDLYTMPKQGYSRKKEPPMTDPISRVHQDPKQSAYTTERLPIKITLLHRKDKDEYSERGTIISALETYQTVVTFDFK